MLAAIFGWVLRMASTGILRDILNTLGVATGDQKTIVTVAAIQAEVQARMAARDVLIAEQGWWVTRMIRPMFAYPLIFYYAAIVFDSMPLFGHEVGAWRISTLPQPMMDWSGWIICAYFLTRPFESLGSGILQTVARTSWFKRIFGGS